MTMTGIILSGFLATQIWQVEQQRPEPRQKAATGQGAQQAEDNLETITGKVVETKAVQLRGSDVQHQAVLVRTTENVLLVADLGPSTDPRTQPVREGQQVTIVGRTGRVGDRAVLLAAMIKSGNRTIEVERTEEVAAEKRELDMEKTSELTGNVRRQKEVDIRGTNQKHQVILLESQDGYQVAVDLGPAQALPELGIGQEITVKGHPVQIGERLVFWAEEVRDAEENTTTIERSKAGARPRGTRHMDKPKNEMKETHERAE